MRTLFALASLAARMLVHRYLPLLDLLACLRVYTLVALPLRWLASQSSSHCYRLYQTHCDTHYCLFYLLHLLNLLLFAALLPFLCALDPDLHQRYNEELDLLRKGKKHTKEHLERLTKLRDGQDLENSIREARLHHSIQAEAAGLTEEEYREHLVNRARAAKFSEEEVDQHKVLVTFSPTPLCSHAGVISTTNISRRILIRAHT